MRRRLLLFLAMLAAVALVGVTLYLDASREATAALNDFAREQAALAEAVAVEPRGAEGASIEKPGSVVVIEASDGVLRRLDGTTVTSPPLAEAIARGDHTLKLARPDAFAIGLPSRTAVAGIATSRGHAVAVVATALRVRDREIRAQNRLLLGIGLAGLLVGIFGGIALRIQRKELLLERELLVKEAEKASEERLARADKLATMGAFATGIAHEIATPLGVIAARTDMLVPRVAADDRGARAAQSILEQTEKIRSIIKSFLALARGEVAAQARLSPSDVLQSAKRMVEHRFGSAGVALAVDVAPKLPTIFGEPRLLEQALVNLLLNACDASQSGQRVRASVRVDGDRVCFSVEDEGIGIDPSVAARATEPFFTTKPDGAGSGLGLAIASEIAKHHQGRFTIGPRASGGTEARLELPIAGTSPKERAA